MAEGCGLPQGRGEWGGGSPPPPTSGDEEENIGKRSVVQRTGGNSLCVFVRVDVRMRVSVCASVYQSLKGNEGSVLLGLALRLALRTMDHHPIGQLHLADDEALWRHRVM